MNFFLVNKKGLLFLIPSLEIISILLNYNSAQNNKLADNEFLYVSSGNLN